MRDCLGRQLWLREAIAYRPAARHDRQFVPPIHMQVFPGWVDEASLRWDAGDDVVDHLLKTGALLVEAPPGAPS